MTDHEAAAVAAAPPPPPPPPGGGHSRSRGGGVGAPSSLDEEANPFSFKEFVRSKNQNSTMLGNESYREGTLEVGAGSSTSPKEASRFSLIQDDSLSPAALELSLSFHEPFFPDPSILPTSLLEDEDDAEWTSTYQPFAVEEAHATGRPSTILGSTYDSFYSNTTSDLSDLQTFSPWQLRGSDPLGKGDHSWLSDGATPRKQFDLPLQPTYEQLKQENSQLRSKIDHLQAVSETRAERVKQLEQTLEDNKRKEECEARDLEGMVQQVEENLQLMTRRAMKAESKAVRLKQENTLLQVQIENCKLENEALQAGHSAHLAVVKQNTDIAVHNLLTVITKSRSSIKQLISGAEELQFVAELLKSIDKISEVPEDSP